MIQNLSPREKVMLAVTGIAVLAAGFYFFLLRPQLDTYAYINEQLQLKQTQLQKAEAILLYQQAEMKKAEQVKAQLAKYEPFFNTDFRAGSVLVLIGLKATELQITINNLEPGGIVDKESYMELPLKLGLLGYFDKVRKLLDEIERLPNLVEIRSLQVTAAEPAVMLAGSSGRLITGGTEDTGAAGATPVNVQCELVIYSDPIAEGRLYLEQEKIQGWKIGRKDPFTKPGPVSPHPEVPVPAVTVDGDTESVGVRDKSLPPVPAPEGIPIR